MTDLDPDLGALARARLARAAAAQANDPALIGLAIRVAETQGTLFPAARPRRRLVFACGGSGTLRQGIETDRRALGPDEDCVAIAVPEAGDTRPPGSWDSIGRFATAISVGAQAVKDAGEQGVRVIVLPAPDETVDPVPALALIALLAPAAASAVLAPTPDGSAADAAARIRALDDRVRRADAMADRIAALAFLCPSDLAAMAGAIVEARRFPLTVVIDSAAAAAAAFVAREIDGSSPDELIGAGPIGSPAYGLALRALSLDPVIVAATAGPALPRLLQTLDEAAALFALPASPSPPA